MDKCLEGNLINKKIYGNFLIKKVSVIIPVYNCQNSILSVIRSIQNQNMDEIEIILVNDNSNDNSLIIIKQLQKEDRRIQIINNKKNMGILYSRCIGVLEAKSKYIFPLDNDDMFFDYDVFSSVYKEAINSNYDIVGFKAIQAESYYSKIKEMKDGCHMHNNSFIIKQPELSLFGIAKDDKLRIIEVHIWSKCIKSSIYKKGVNNLGKKKYSLHVTWAEDTSMVFILFNIAYSYRYITKYGIFRHNKISSTSNNITNSNALFGEIFFLDIIFDFTKNSFISKKIVIYKAIQLQKSQFFNLLNERNRDFLFLVLKKIYNCHYIYNEDKKVLKNIYNKIFNFTNC